ncbi:MAG: nuclear transport factor 2 family protein [Actinomycetota bacterium]
MSQENVETVRKMYEALNRDDVDGFLQLCAPGFEVRDLPELPGSSVAVGHEAVRAWWDQLFDPFEDLRFDAEEFIDAGDRVVVLNHATARGRGSGAKVEMHFASVWTLNDGKAVRFISYSDHAEALEAAGLSE